MTWDRFSRRLALIREARQRRAPLSGPRSPFGGAIGAELKAARLLARQQGSVETALRAGCPFYDALRIGKRTTRGTLTIRCGGDNALAYELGILLEGGLLDAVRVASEGTIKWVKVLP